MKSRSNYNGVLHLFTTRFPYGLSEPFLENEIPFLASFFKEVRIYPLFKEAKVRELPKGVVVIDLFNDPYQPAGYWQLLKNFGLFSGILKQEKSRTKGAVKNEVWAELRSSLRQNLYRALVLKAQLKEHTQDDVFYSYWTFDWATVLAMLVKMNVIPGFVSRVHGFDLYEERSKKGFIPFRQLQLEESDKIVAVSKDGLKYLKKNYEQHSRKFYLSHLGVQDHGIGPFPLSSIPHIVSCSNVIPLKRVGLIAQALKAWNKSVTWTHFGGGNGMDEILEVINSMPQNIDVNLKGAVPNAEILEFYRTQEVSLFLHLSSSEGGVSVAMQEAASFGIPLMGAAVGGVPEICNENTGVLLSPDPDVGEVTEALDGFFNNSKNNAEFRGQVKAYWAKQFKAETVFPLFCQLLVAR